MMVLVATDILLEQSRHRCKLMAENAELHAKINAMDLAVGSWKWLYGKAEAENEELQVLNVAYEKQVGEHIALRASLCNEIAELEDRVENQHSIFMSDQKKMNQARLILGGV